MISITSLLLQLHEQDATPLPTNDTVTWYHGGRNLDIRSGIKPGQTGSWEFGPGLYLTNDYPTARKYSKGGGSVYAVTVRKGMDISHVEIDSQTAANFVKSYVKVALRKKLLADIERYGRSRSPGESTIDADSLVNLCINSDALIPSRTTALRQLLVDQGVDYGVFRYHGGALVMVVYNPDIVSRAVKVNPPTDQYQVELPDAFKPRFWST